MFLHLAGHLDTVDRRRIADGASFCGWLRSWGRTVAHQVEREITATTSRSVIPADKLVSLDALTDPTNGIPMDRLPYITPPEANCDPDLVDPAAVRASLARRRGAGRMEVIARVVHDALGTVPPLLRPEDPAETQMVRRLIMQCPRLARISLDEFCDRVDNDGPGGPHVAPEAMVAMWDATTVTDRQRLAAMPDRLLALLVEDVVRLAPRPRAAVRHAVRRALASAARQAPARLLDELADVFWDEATEPVSDHRTDITDAERQRVREEADRNARRLPALVAELVLVPGQTVGGSVGEVRAFLRQAWAAREAS
ncbi:hypothetical protein [Actinomyces gaoshouyii]|uniref:hypothetical protein n=1 Tax=Actinomyces gaoshouyii TaxID=1960083 RepID=UPI000F76E00E|nr:hypothetical protein [Actinomyces gaoshouyii]